MGLGKRLDCAGGYAWHALFREYRSGNCYGLGLWVSAEEADITALEICLNNAEYAPYHLY